MSHPAALAPHRYGHGDEREVVDMWSSAAGTANVHEDAARVIQLAALPRLIGNRQKFWKVTISGFTAQIQNGIDIDF